MRSKSCEILWLAIALYAASPARVSGQDSSDGPVQRTAFAQPQMPSARSSAVFQKVSTANNAQEEVAEAQDGQITDQQDYYADDPPQSQGGNCPVGGCPAGRGADGHCQSANCNSSGNLRCDDPGPCLIATAESTFFWPQLNRGVTTMSGAYSTGGPAHSFLPNSSANGNFLVAPRVSLGIQGERWGLVGRYWNASTWSDGFSPSTALLASPGQTSFDAFRAYTADLEVQRRFTPGLWRMYAFGGVRYVSAANDRSVSVAATDGGANIFSSSTLVQQSFNGTGITFGLWGARPLCAGSPWEVFVANRYSVLWGNGSATASTGAGVSTGGGSAAGFDTASAKGSNGELFIAEVQLGLQWSHQLRCIPGRAFIRVAGEYQYWANNFGLTAATSSTAFSGSAATTTSAHVGDMLFNLIGFNIGAGILY